MAWMPALTFLANALACAVAALLVARLFAQWEAEGTKISRRLAVCALIIAAILDVGAALLLGVGLGAGPGPGLSVGLAAGGVAGLAAGGIEALVLLGLWRPARQLRHALARAVVARAQVRTRQARAETEMLRDVLEMAQKAARFGHWHLAPDGRAMTWSAQMYELHGVSTAVFAPNFEKFINLLQPDDRRTVTHLFAIARGEGGSFEIDAGLRWPDGQERHVKLCGAGRAGEGVHGVAVDVTERRMAEARLHAANHAVLEANAALKNLSNEDEATGLVTRQHFDTSLVHEFKRASRSCLPLGLILLRIDRFDAYRARNDAAAAAACLRRVAQAVKSVPRRLADLSARYDDTEFAVLLPLADLPGTMRVAGLIQEAVQSLMIPDEGGEDGFVTVSCGVAACLGGQEIDAPTELLHRAEQALAAAGQAGHPHIVRFEPPAAHHGAHATARDMDRLIKSRS